MKYKMYLCLLLVLAVPLLAKIGNYAIANEKNTDIEGKVTKVISGDTIEIISNGSSYIVHVFGIDCPEIGQPYHQEAKEFTSEFVLNKGVWIRVFLQHNSDAIVGKVLLLKPKNPEVFCLSVELVLRGLAWWDPKIGPDEEILKVIQEDARNDKRGLWQDNDPTPPWEWGGNSQ